MMKKSSWLEEFEIEDLAPKMDYSASDYDIFADKDLLDKFRNSIKIARIIKVEWCRCNTYTSG